MTPIEPTIPITSREYKAMLKPHPLSGTSDSLNRTLEALRRSLLSITDLKLKGEFVFEKDQKVRFWDFPQNWLKDRKNYVLRTRKRKNKTTLTLKCRHGDRYFVQSQITSGDQAKFEEDIKPRFTSLYSYSRKVKASAPRSLKELIDIFPDLKNRIETDPPDSPIQLVRDFTARERVYTGVTIKLSKSFDAECAVIIWYDADDPENVSPLVAEFSFRYPMKKWTKHPPPEPFNTFDGKTGLAAHDFYISLQNSREFADAWLDTESKTKTLYAYEGNR